ncbi:MAG: hypothetical protein ACYCXP_12185 [Leptospirillum sp.]|jgi:hypothetical protein
MDIVSYKAEVDGTNRWRYGCDEDNDPDMHDAVFYQVKSFPLDLCLPIFLAVLFIGPPDGFSGDRNGSRSVTRNVRLAVACISHGHPGVC